MTVLRVLRVLRVAGSMGFLNFLPSGSMRVFKLFVFREVFVWLTVIGVPKLNPSQVELTMSWRLKESQFLRHPPILYVCIYIYICTIHTPNYTYIIHSYFIFLYKSWLSFLQRFLATSDCEVLWHCQQNLSWLLFQKHAATISKRSHPTIYQDGTRSLGTEGP